MTPSKAPKTGEDYKVGSVYSFEFDSIRNYPGTGKWFILKNPQTGMNTIPEFEDERWHLRVRPLPFQEDWDEDDAREWNMFDCEVVRFNLDPYTDEETGFPVLRQYDPAVQAKLYPAGEFETTRKFRVTGVPGTVNSNGKTLNFFILEDVKLGYTLAAYAKTFGNDIPEIDAIVDLHVSADGEQKRPFIKTEEDFLKDKEIRALLAAVPSVFSEGSEYDAEVLPQKGFSPDFVYVCVSAMPKLPCRVPILRDVPVSQGDKIRLRCIGFGSSGFPKWAYASTPTGIPVDNLPMLELPSLQETLKLEFKSSLVYPNDGSSEPDIDKQLGSEIASVVASFMNKVGGTVFVGVKNDGTVVGIEAEADKLNANSDSSRKYPPTMDGMQNKIVDELSYHLGKGAAELFDIAFFADEKKRLVCQISVRANQAPIPVFLDRKTLFVRYPGSSRKLEGEELARYILNRAATMTSQTQTSPSAVAPSPVQLPTSLKQVPITKERIVKVDPSAVHRYLNLFSTGEASRTTKPLPVTEPDCFCRIPIPDGAWNKKSRLLFCYDSGRVNVLNPKLIFEKKLNSRGTRYANGFNREHVMMATALCDEDDILIIRTRHKDGTIYVKCVPVGQCRVHSSMETIGNDLTGLENMPVGSKVLDFRLLPASRSHEVVRLKPKKGNWPGMPQETIPSEWVELEKLPPIGILGS